MELTFVREDVPKIVRAGGSGREAEPWENHLAPLKETPDESFRVWTYENKSSAISRKTAVRNRLRSAVPAENWQIDVRIPPGTPPGTSQFGVYVTFAGSFTPAEIKANIEKHEARSKTVSESRAAAKAAREAEAGAQAPEKTDTAKNRVTEARQRKAS